MYTLYAVYDRMFGEIPAKISVYAPYAYGFGQPLGIRGTSHAEFKILRLMSEPCAGIRLQVLCLWPYQQH